MYILHINIENTGCDASICACVFETGALNIERRFYFCRNVRSYNRRDGNKSKVVFKWPRIGAKESKENVAKVKPILQSIFILLSIEVVVVRRFCSFFGGNFR